MTCSFEIMWQAKNISTTRVPMATTFYRVVAYCQGLLPIKSDNTVTIWSWKITWQIKIISSIPKSLWPPNRYNGDFPWRASTHKVTWRFDHGLERWCDILKPYYQDCLIVYGCQTWQDGNSLGWTSTLNTWSCKITW